MQALQLKQYLMVTANYWVFTITDGALRMLVVLYFHSLGYSPFEVAMLFIFYEFFGVVTNLFGGWLGARIGLNQTMHIGLLLQVAALVMLLVDPVWLSVAYVMFAQALSGIAKDLNKMSAKSSIKLLIPQEARSTLYKWIAILTGSKNALKGIGFFIGGLLLAVIGFRMACLVMAVMLLTVLSLSHFLLHKDLGKTKFKPKFKDVFSKSYTINWLSAARLFLFGSRDVWFVVALPVYLQAVLGWDYLEVGGFLALWIIIYGFIQSLAPYVTGVNAGKIPGRSAVLLWTLILAFVPAGMIVSFYLTGSAQITIVFGLFLYAIVFAINSSMHSFLIVSYAKHDQVSLDVGFYYMSNAAGRLLGTVLSGLVYQMAGLSACLLISFLFVLLAFGASLRLPYENSLSTS